MSNKGGRIYKIVYELCYGKLRFRVIDRGQPAYCYQVATVCNEKGSPVWRPWRVGLDTSLTTTIIKQLVKQLTGNANK